MILKFEQELISLINKHSLENTSNTPDSILSSFMVECLISFNRAVNKRNNWYEKKPSKESISIAYRIWRDFDMQHCEIDIEKTEKIAVIIDEILEENNQR